MIETLEIGEQVITKPLEGLFVLVIQNVVLPDETIFWIVQRVKLVEQEAFISWWRLDEVDHNNELCQCGVAPLTG